MTRKRTPTTDDLVAFVQRGQAAQQAVDAVTRLLEPVIVRDPETPLEWRTATALADAWLRVDAAKQYGLIDGGPAIAVDRCLYLLEAGRARDVVPTESEVNEAIGFIVAAFARRDQGTR